MIGQRFRVRLAAKLLVMYLAVGATVSVSIGTISYRTAEKAMTKNVYDNMDALATDVAHQIDAINKRHFQTMHVLAELSMIKDENVSLAEKQKEIVDSKSCFGANCIDIAFYDANGDALLADGRKINFANRPYFQEAFAGKVSLLTLNSVLLQTASFSIIVFLYTIKTARQSVQLLW